MGWIADLLQEIPSAARYKVELEKLESEHKILKTENTHLRAELEAAKLEIAELKKQTEQVHGSDLPEIQTQILTLLARSPGMDTQHVAARTAQGYEAAKFHLNELHEANFIHWATGQDFDTVWHLDQAGRRYLIQRGLLK